MCNLREREVVVSAEGWAGGIRAPELEGFLQLILSTRLTDEKNGAQRGAVTC